MAMAAASATAEQATFESSLLCWVQQSLKHHLYGNATFLAERLHAHAPSEDSVHVLASCHFAAGEKVRAYHVLQGCHAAHNRYLLALCCLELGHLNEAERVLLGPAAPGTAGGAHAPPAEAADVPNGAAGLYLLGTICFKSQRREQAARYFTRALELNPYLWSAYEGLCQLGVELPPLGAAAAPQLPQGLPWAHPANGAYADPSAGAQQTAPRASQPIHAPGSQAPGSAMPATPAPFSPAGFSPAGGLFAFTPMSLGAGGPLSPLPALSASVPGPVTAERGMGVVGMWGQPSSAGTPMSDSPDPAQVGAPARWRAGGGAIGGAMGGWLLGLGSAGGSAPFSAGGVGSAAELAATPVVDESARASSQRKATRASSGSALAAASGAPPVRRSSRLSGGAPQFGTTPAAGGHSGEADLPLGVGAENAEGVCPAAALLHHLARALLAVCTYRCAEALQLFDELSPRQRRTGWVLCQQGRAHFESVNYAEELALEELLALREFAPKEGAVHLLLGRIYKKLGQPQPALVCMSTALDLNPKDAQMIKAAIHKLNSADDDDVDDGP
ncbi:anaphase-promoting complex, cyclosome, subunit 3-domain-containing protein [Pavlovales sp. CCMP2436]|nr:anaphase-promoting complex, cyclosome, subunit 3-domain-containing protein [Pavlovales sp. CCMP2436]